MVVAGMRDSAPRSCTSCQLPPVGPPACCSLGCRGIHAELSRPTTVYVYDGGCNKID